MRFRPEACDPSAFCWVRGLSRECVQHALRWWRDACRQSAPFPGCLCLAGSALALCASDGAAVTVWTDPFGEPGCVLDLPNVTSLSTDGRTVLCASSLATHAYDLLTRKTVRLGGGATAVLVTEGCCCVARLGAVEFDDGSTFEPSCCVTRLAGRSGFRVFGTGCAHHVDCWTAGPDGRRAHTTLPVGRPIADLAVARDRVAVACRDGKVLTWDARTLEAVTGDEIPSMDCHAMGRVYTICEDRLHSTRV